MAKQDCKSEIKMLLLIQHTIYNFKFILSWQVPGQKKRPVVKWRNSQVLICSFSLSRNKKKYKLINHLVNEVKKTGYYKR